MGRVKLKMKRIENITNRQVTFSKRRNGLIKKAYEISVLCDIDLALIMFSPFERLTQFSSKTRIEDVFTRFINLSEQERVSCCNTLENSKCLMSTLNQLNIENEVALQRTNEGTMKLRIEELVQEIGWLNQQVETAEEQLSIFEPGPSSMNSLEELESCQKQLQHILAIVTEKKEYLLNYYASSSQNPSCMQEMQQQIPTHVEDNSQIFDASVPFIPLRNISSAAYDPILQFTSSNMNVASMGECHLFSLIQQGVEKPGITLMPHDHGENASNSSDEKSDTKAANYGGNSAQSCLLPGLNLDS